LPSSTGLASARSSSRSSASKHATRRHSPLGFPLNKLDETPTSQLRSCRSNDEHALGPPVLTEASLDQPALRELRILTEISQRQDLTQRGLAATLGIALGLANLYVKRLARKGYIKITTIPPNRVGYLLTPRGLAEKTRLTYEFMEYSLRLYRGTRGMLRETLTGLAARGQRRIVLYGTGEAAELAYLTIAELGLTVMCAVSDNGHEDHFLGVPVRPLSALRDDEIDAVILATFAPAPDVVRRLEILGIASDKIVALA
jgi:DNA-binding MarR family transcriptional regulator